MATEGYVPETTARLT